MGNIPYIQIFKIESKFPYLLFKSIFHGFYKNNTHKIIKGLSITIKSSFLLYYFIFPMALLISIDKLYSLSRRLSRIFKTGLSAPLSSAC